MRDSKIVRAVANLTGWVIVVVITSPNSFMKGLFIGAALMLIDMSSWYGGIAKAEESMKHREDRLQEIGEIAERELAEAQLFHSEALEMSNKLTKKFEAHQKKSKK